MQQKFNTTKLLYTSVQPQLFLIITIISNPLIFESQKICYDSPPHYTNVHLCFWKRKDLTYTLPYHIWFLWAELHQIILLVCIVKNKWKSDWIRGRCKLCRCLFGFGKNQVEAFMIWNDRFSWIVSMLECIEKDKKLFFSAKRDSSFIFFELKKVSFVIKCWFFAAIRITKACMRRP